MAWASGLRSFMTEVAGAGSEVHGGDTFRYVLLLGTVTGALLRRVEAERRAVVAARGWRCRRWRAPRS